MMDLSSNSLTFKATSLLKEIQKRGDFGLLVQGLFAHTLLRLGARIQDIKPQGHPDLICTIRGENWKVEVAVMNIPYFIDAKDLEGIQPRGSGWRGFLALLYCGPPLWWLLLPYEAIWKRSGQRLYPLELKILSDHYLSSQCSECFSLLLLENQERLENLGFTLLREWALAGHGI